jgi:hypothetical protein
MDGGDFVSEKQVESLLKLHFEITWYNFCLPHIILCSSFFAAMAGASGVRQLRKAEKKNEEVRER